MSELAAAEMFSLPAKNKTAKAWQAVLWFLGFLFHILIQVLRDTPSLTQVLSFIRIRHPLLPSSSAAFRPLPTDIPTDTPPSPSAVAAEEPLDKLTAIEAGLNCFELECISTDKDLEGKPKVNYVTVFERPGLHDFLHQTSEFADLILFTAGLEGYARPLVDRIDVEKRFSHRLYRPATVSTEYREHVKDLSCISKDLCRIVLVDNNPFSFLLQPLNGVPCIPFSAGQPCDEQLMMVLLPLLKHLSHIKDARPVLYERFHMPEWFQKHGIPTSARVL